MRKKRLESIMSRVNRSDRSLSRGVANSESSNSLTGATAGNGNGNGSGDIEQQQQPIASGDQEQQQPVQFSLGTEGSTIAVSLLFFITEVSLIPNGLSQPHFCLSQWPVSRLEESWRQTPTLPNPEYPRSNDSTLKRAED